MDWLAELEKQQSQRETADDVCVQTLERSINEDSPNAPARSVSRYGGAVPVCRPIPDDERAEQGYVHDQWWNSSRVCARNRAHRVEAEV